MNKLSKRLNSWFVEGRIFDHLSNQEISDLMEIPRVMQTVEDAFEILLPEKEPIDD